MIESEKLLFSIMDTGRRARIQRAFIGFFALLLIAQVTRTIAADLVPSDPVAVVDAPTAAPAPTDLPSPTDAPAPAPTPSEAAPAPTDAPTPTDSAGPTPSATPTPVAPHAVSDQSMTIRVPAVINVDPRARSVYLPQIAAYGPANLLVCVSSGQVVFDIAGQNQSDPKLGTLVTGDLTSVIRAAGVGSTAVGAVNSSNGLRAISINQGISGKFITMSFVALSEPSINAALCAAGSASNTRTISIQSIGLNIDMAGGNVTLKK